MEKTACPSARDAAQSRSAQMDQSKSPSPSFMICLQRQKPSRETVGSTEKYFSLLASWEVSTDS